jgi:lysophospholipase L1-like esterase
LISALIATAAASFLAKTNPGEPDDGYQKTMVFLGDSISEGLLGASPLSERDSYAYYAVVGRRNNYRYIESAVSGDTAYYMYKRLTNDTTVSAERRYWVSQADIIHISILGNDLLGGNIGRTACEARQGDYTNINKMLERGKEYLELSIEKIRELNPNAVILINTLYNPLDYETNLLSESQKSELLALGGGDPSVFRTVGTDLITRLNRIIYEYQVEHPGEIEIIDVYSEFDRIYKANRTDGICLFYGDWLHPSNEGHAVIADLLQKKLEELGLADADDAVARYIRLRVEQLVRLYSGTGLDLKSVIADIKKAATCSEVSEAYFLGVRGITPIYANADPVLPAHAGEVFDTTRKFMLTSLTADRMDLALMLNAKKSGFTFYEDGTFSLKLTPEIAAVDLANYFLEESGGINLETDLGTGNFATGVGVYIENIFPGFSFRDFKKDLKLFASCGIYLNGFDFNSPNVINLVDSMQADASIPSDFRLPYGLSLELKGCYFIERAGDFTEIYLCVGDVSRDGYPFLYATLHTEPDGSCWLETSIEVSKVTLYAAE